MLLLSSSSSLMLLLLLLLLPLLLCRFNCCRCRRRCWCASSTFARAPLVSTERSLRPQVPHTALPKYTKCTCACAYSSPRNQFPHALGPAGRLPACTSPLVAARRRNEQLPRQNRRRTERLPRQNPPPQECHRHLQHGCAMRCSGGWASRGDACASSLSLAGGAATSEAWQKPHQKNTRRSS